MNVTNIVAKNILGYCGTTITSALYLPQLIHMVKKKSTKDVSHIFLSLNIVSCSIWLAYGIVIIDYPIIICDTVISLITFSMIGVKCYFDKSKKEEKNDIL